MDRDGGQVQVTRLPNWLFSKSTVQEDDHLTAFGDPFLDRVPPEPLIRNRGQNHF